MALSSTNHRVAIITGGAQGIGRGIAKFLLGHTAGFAASGSYASAAKLNQQKAQSDVELQAPQWNVVIVDSNEEGIEDAKTTLKSYLSPAPLQGTVEEDSVHTYSGEADPTGHAIPRVSFVHGDCADEATAEEALHVALSRYGRVDLLVNNAGGGLFKAPLRGQTLHEFYDVLHRNVGTAYVFSKTVGNHWETQLEKKRAGVTESTPLSSSSAGTFGTNLHNAIVNISSTRAIQSEHFSEAYAAGKGGVVALTHALASSLAHVARVNGINLGWIDVSGRSYGPGREEYEKSQEDISQHWCNKVGEADDVAHAVMFLYENYFMSGQCITLDGGMSKRMLYAE